MVSSIGGAFGQDTAAVADAVSEDRFQSRSMDLNGEQVNLDMRHYGPSIKYGVVPAPYPPGGRSNATSVGGNYQVIPEGAKEPTGTFRFLEWWSGSGSPEALATICNWGGIPEVEEYLSDNWREGGAMHVALYARVSTTDKDQNPEMQLRPLREHLATLEATDAGVFVDHVSADNLRSRKA